MTQYTKITSGSKRSEIEAATLADAIKAARSKRTTVSLYLANGFWLGVVLTSGEFVPAY